MGSLGAGRDEAGHNAADKRARGPCIVIGCDEPREARRFCKKHKGRAPIYPEHYEVIGDDGVRYVYTRGYYQKNRSTFVLYSRWHVMHNKDKYKYCHKCKRPNNFDEKFGVFVKVVNDEIRAMCSPCMTAVANKEKTYRDRSIKKSTLKHVKFMHIWKQAQRIEGLKSRYCTR